MFLLGYCAADLHVRILIPASSVSLGYFIHQQEGINLISLGINPSGSPLYISMFVTFPNKEI